MAHQFVIMRKGLLETYTNYEDIPEDFDNIIQFIPEIPDGPHSHDQHAEIAEWHDKLQLLIQKENQRYGHS